jgi:hypothetical protein
MLPIALQNHIAAVSEQFGGYSAVEKLIPKSQLYYLSLFPGPFFVTSPWVLYSAQFENYAPELKLAGHILGEQYKVYNRELSFLFKGNSALFGESEQEKLLINSAYNGEFFHIQVSTQYGPKLVVLWVSKVVPRNVQERAGRALRESVKPVSQNSHEIFLSSEGFSSVRIYSYRGVSKLTAKEIENSGQAEVIEITNGRTIRLTPKVSTWYAFEANGSSLRVAPTGVGEERWTNHGDVYHFESQNQYLVGRDKLDLSDFSLSRQNQAHLFGQLTSPLVSSGAISGSSEFAGIPSEPTQLLVTGSIIRKGLLTSVNSDNINPRIVVFGLGVIQGASLELSGGEFNSTTITYGSIEGNSPSSTAAFEQKIETSGLITVEPILVSPFTQEFQESAFESFFIPRSTGSLELQIFPLYLNINFDFSDTHSSLTLGLLGTL